MTNSYHFISRWRIKGRVEEVFEIIGQPLEYPRWWPSVYLNVRPISPPKADGTGRRVSFFTRGFLPYTLRWEATTREVVVPTRIVVDATGDFEGRGVWSLEQNGAHVDITFDWKVAANKPLLHYFASALRPLFEANHRWAMAQGEASLREELIRYRARTPEELLAASEPRGPVKVPGRWITVGAIALSAAAGVALIRRHSRKSA